MCELSSAKGIVYRIACSASNKSYIGQTGKEITFFDRYSIKRSMTNKTQNELFAYFRERYEKSSSQSQKMTTEIRKAITTFPPETFHVTVLAKGITNDEERDGLEVKFIKKFNALEGGYNSVKSVFSNTRNRSGSFPYSVINLSTMEEIRGENVSDFCRKIINEIKPVNINMLEKLRNVFLDLPKISNFKSHNNTSRWCWGLSIQYLSIYGYASSWWLKNGLPDHMEIVPHEYDTKSGKITKPLLKVKDSCFKKHKARKKFNAEPFTYHLDPIQNKKHKEDLKKELTDAIMQKAILYAEKLAEEYKHVLDAPFGPGGVTSFLNQKALGAPSRGKAKYSSIVE